MRSDVVTILGTGRFQAVMSNFADHAALKALPGYKHPALLQLALYF